MEQLRRYLSYLYSGSDGYAVVSAIEGDPREKLSPYWESFLRLGHAGSLDLLAAYVAGLSERSAVNAYVSTWSYARPRRVTSDSSDSVLPTPIVFVDDAPAEVTPRWSFYVRTSPNRGQGYYRLYEALGAGDNRALRRLLAGALQTDDCSDLARVARPPGSVNYKALLQAPFTADLVDYEVEYSVQDVMALVRLSPSPGGVGLVDWSAVDAWLRRLPELTVSRGGILYPRRVNINNPKNPALAILRRGEVPGTPVERYHARHTLAQSLALHGYPDEEIAALLVTLARYGDPDDVLVPEVEKLISQVRHYDRRSPTVARELQWAR